eukprot:CAMPEP_0173116488 /NCGR_PEP_ID=MMETSP1102-20130122/49419_1 /TAXON_ID=49646 /ORGANISM="Geminigera sp., Strain Caron Lab Isolate" /LENGTH=49 /DNA_ID=CAMNT_0014020311 /DNA_START=67 /DNA_END=216 /DNA_ORIENTATION=+
MMLPSTLGERPMTLLDESERAKKGEVREEMFAVDMTSTLFAPRLFACVL